MVMSDPNCIWTAVYKQEPDAMICVTDQVIKQSTVITEQDRWCLRVVHGEQVIAFAFQLYITEECDGGPTTQACSMADFPAKPAYITQHTTEPRI